MAARPGRLLCGLLLIAVASLAAPAALPLLVIVAGFLLAGEGKRIDPASTTASLAAIALLAVGTGFVLTGPWIYYWRDFEGASRLDYVSLPVLLLLGVSRGAAIGGWIIVLVAGSWLTYARESLWPQWGVLAISLLPLPFLMMIAAALRNA